VAKPNFNFQKRQKELARQKKNEEKRQRKLERAAQKNPGEQEPAPEAQVGTEQNSGSV
jgi:hypothetical protein